MLEESSPSEQNALKRRRRLSALVFAALTAAYALTFPWHKAPMLAVLPVAAAGLFYGRRGGWLAALAALLFNPLLLWACDSPIPWQRFADFERQNFFLTGHFLTLLIGIGSGYLRETAERNAESERALRASEKRFRSLYENAAIGIYSATPDGRILLANPALVKMLGYESFEELAQRNLEQEGFAPESPRSRFLQAIEREGAVNGFEEVWLRKDGSQFYARENAKAIRDAQGKILRFEGTVEDVSEKKQAEENLQERELRLQNILESTTDAIITLDETQRIFSFSKSAEAMFGYAAEEVVGQPLDTLMPARYGEVHREHVRRFEKVKSHLLKKSERKPIVCRRKDGGEFPAEASISKFAFKGKTVFVAFIRDMSERVQQEKEAQARARFLLLLNEATRKIIAAKDFTEAAKSAAADLAEMFEADSCYVTRWDEAQRRVFPAATTERGLSQRYEAHIHDKNKKNLSLSALQSGKVIAAEDYENSPHTNPEIARQFPIQSALSVPLIYGGNWLGALILGYRQTRRFTAEELARAEQVGSQISLAVWSLHQDMELQRSLREEKALAEIVQALSEGERVGLEKVLNLIVNAARNLIPKAGQAVIHLLDEEEQILASLAVSGLKELEGSKRNIRLGEGIAGQVILRGEPINIADVLSDSRFLQLPGGKPTYRSLLVAPVRSGERNLGTISVQSGEPDAFSPNDVNLLSQLGAQAAIAIENANLLESTRQSLKETNALYRINQGLAASLDPDALMKETVELLQESFGYYYVQIFVVEPGSGNFIMRAGSGEVGKHLLNQGHKLAPGEGVVGGVIATGQAFFTNNVDDAVFFVRNPLLPETKSELAAPLKIGEAILGALDVQQKPPKPLTKRDMQLVTAVAEQLAVALQKADLYESLQVALQQEKAIRNQMMQNERLTVMGRLLATVAHELNNPLQAIQNALFLLREEQGLSPQGKQDLEIVLAEAERMANLIERLRATYRPIQSEDFQLTQINDIVEDVRALIATHMRHHQITFEFHPDPDLPRIPALSDQIRQVTLNLLMNACEAMPNGGALTVSTRLLAETNEAMLKVSDTGPGIPEELLPSIFNAFVTNKPSGTGLGLTISQDIVMKHRGRIQAENNPQGGASFTVWLPLENGEFA